MRLKETINRINYCCQGKRVSLGRVTDSIEAQAFGILLLLPALIVILPVSLIPGVSSLCALVALFTSLHIFFGRDELWLPQRIRNISFNSSKMVRALEKTNVVTKNIDRFSRPRLIFMTEGIAGKLVAATVILLASATIILGFIPLIDMALMLPVVFFGLGNYTHDGLITGIGWLVLSICAGSIGLFI